MFIALYRLPRLLVARHVGATRRRVKINKTHQERRDMDLRLIVLTRGSCLYNGKRFCNIIKKKQFGK